MVASVVLDPRPTHHPLQPGLVQPVPRPQLRSPHRAPTGSAVSRSPNGSGRSPRWRIDAVDEPITKAIAERHEVPEVVFVHVSRRLHLDGRDPTVARFGDDVDLPAVAIPPVEQPNRRVVPRELPSEFSDDEGLQQRAGQRRLRTAKVVDRGVQHGCREPGVDGVDLGPLDRSMARGSRPPRHGVEQIERLEQPEVLLDGVDRQPQIAGAWPTSPAPGRYGQHELHQSAEGRRVVRAGAIQPRSRCSNVRT